MRIFLCLLFLTFSCSTVSTGNQTNAKELKFEENDDGEYDIIVFDTQYDYFLNAVALPKDYYSESFYRNRNLFLVTEWNYRHAQPQRFDPNLYEVSIDYNSQIEYGKEFEYKLYNFFKFIEWKYRVDLDGRPNRR